jgi:hypothetical protein
MSLTKRVPQDKLEAYFDGFSKHFLKNESTEVADVELLDPEFGDQHLAEGAHLIGITYEPHDNALDIALEGGDHRVYKPKEVWAVEEDDGFVRAFEIVCDDDTREVVRVRRIGVRRAD